MIVEAATGNVLTYIRDSISVIYFKSFMLSSSDSNHNSNIKLELSKFHTKRNTKTCFPNCRLCGKIFKINCNLQNHFFPLSPFLTKSKFLM